MLTGARLGIAIHVRAVDEEVVFRGKRRNLREGEDRNHPQRHVSEIKVESLGECFEVCGSGGDERNVVAVRGERLCGSPRLSLGTALRVEPLVEDAYAHSKE